jgi:decaprenyl-phosphate phosphoribosyltransferase
MTTTLIALVRSMRPTQSLKNLLVFAAPAAAGVLDERDKLLAALAAFAAFSLVASGTYLLNDLADRERDRQHPLKRHRPIAAGELPVPTAVVASLVLIGSGGSVSLAWINPGFSMILAGYLVNTIVYSYFGKHEPIIDVLQVSLGFVLRAVGGAIAVDVVISEWFAAVALFGSLLVVVGKRLSEHTAQGPDSWESRPSLERYSPSFLRHLHAVSTAGLLLVYSLWAFETAESANTTFPWFELSIAPMVVAILRYDYAIDAGRAETPEHAIFSDGVLLAAAAIWIGLFAIGIYG